MITYKQAAYEYYIFKLKGHRKEKNLLKGLNFSDIGVIPPRVWEAFAALLVNDKAKPGGKGSDLMNHEVKSSSGYSFEYQYHKNTGIEKLNSDSIVNHIYIVYSNDYEDIDVWYVSNTQISSIILGWKQSVIDAYSTSASRQRCRKNIQLGFVKKVGTHIFQVKDGILQP